MNADNSPNPDANRHTGPKKRRRWKTRSERDREQAIADWFQVESVLDEKKGMQPIETLLNEVLARLPLGEPLSDPDLLRKGWKAAAGNFISSNADLVSIVRGVATIRVTQPSMRYHLQEWETAMLDKLQQQFGQEIVTSVKYILG